MCKLIVSELNFSQLSRSMYQLLIPKVIFQLFIVQRFPQKDKPFWNVLAVCVLINLIFIFHISYQDLAEEVECLKMKDETLTSSLQCLQQEQITLSENNKVCSFMTSQYTRSN